MPPEDPVLKQARYWLVRQQSGDMSAAESRALEAWLDADPSHRDAYERISALWDSMKGIGARQFPARAAARSFRRSPAQPWLASTVTVLLFAAITLGVLSLRDWHGEINVYRTAKGEQQRVTLPDGSVAQLNTDTELRVVYARGARSIHLERGQALFSVKKDVDRPFEVITRSGRAMALGTRFDVHLQDDRTVVAVVDGMVRVTTARTGPVHVAAGEGISWSPRGDFLGHHPIDPAAVLAWQKGRLHFDRTPLAEVMAEVARYHTISYRFAEPSLALLQVSGSFRTNDLPRLFAVLEAALPVRTSIQGTLVQIEPRPS